MLKDSLPYGTHDLRAKQKGYRKIMLEDNTTNIQLMYWHKDQDDNTLQECPLPHKSTWANWLRGPSQKEILGPRMCRKIKEN